MGRLILAQLHDELGQVGLACVDARCLQVLVHADFLGGHGLNLDHIGLAGGANQTFDDLVGFLGIACPVDDAAASLDCLFELLEQFRHAGCNIFFDGGTCSAQLLPIIQLFYSVGALFTNGGGSVLQVVALGGVIKANVSQWDESLAAAQIAVAFRRARWGGIEERGH